MLRSSGIRNYIKEIAESQKFEKLSFFPPFLILLVEIILLIHALEIQVFYVIELTIILVVLSIIEIFIVMSEIHQHYRQINFDRILTIKLDDLGLASRAVFLTQNANCRRDPTGGDAGKARTNATDGVVPTSTSNGRESPQIFRALPASGPSRLQFEFLSEYFLGAGVSCRFPFR